MLAIQSFFYSGKYPRTLRVLRIVFDVEIDFKETVVQSQRMYPPAGSCLEAVGYVELIKYE